MPNWCQNSVYIEAPSADIQAITDGVNKAAVLNSLYPEPEHAENTEDHMPAWWRWRVDNWGTKWDAAAEIPPKAARELDRLHQVEIAANALIASSPHLGDEATVVVTVPFEMLKRLADVTGRELSR